MEICIGEVLEIYLKMGRFAIVLQLEERRRVASESRERIQRRAGSTRGMPVVVATVFEGLRRDDAVSVIECRYQFTVRDCCWPYVRESPHLKNNLDLNSQK